MRALSAEFLLVDIGNTQVKLRLASARRLLGSTRRLPTASLLDLTASRVLLETLQGWRFARVVLGSVVPAAAAVVADILPEPILSVQARLDTGVDLRGYPGVRTLGADRLADMAGAWALYGPGPLIVADFGTAAVFNAISAEGVFLGGVIAPGRLSLHGSLPARAAQLPLVKLGGRAPPIGRTTPAALRAGAVYGYRGLVREILAALRSELGAAKVVATGGDASLLARHLPEIDVVDQHMTLQGLRIIGVRNVRPTKLRRRSRRSG